MNKKGRNAVWMKKRIRGKIKPTIVPRPIKAPKEKKENRKLSLNLLDKYWDMMVMFKNDMDYHKLRKIVIKADHIIRQSGPFLVVAIIFYEAILLKGFQFWMSAIFLIQALLILYNEMVYQIRDSEIDNLLARFEEIYPRVESDWKSVETEPEINELVKKYREEWCTAENDVRFGPESPITASLLKVSGENTNQYFRDFDLEYYRGRLIRSIKEKKNDNKGTL